MQAERGTLHGVEKALHGLAAVQQLLRDKRVAGVPFKAIDVDRDKFSRALAWAGRAEAGKVKLVRGEWVNAFLDEVCAFPLGKHDDQVDTISGGVLMIGVSTPPPDAQPTKPNPFGVSRATGSKWSV
jgi:predicted phage terminase large subunit-like protein